MKEYEYKIKRYEIREGEGDEHQKAMRHLEFLKRAQNLEEAREDFGTDEYSAKPKKEESYTEKE